MWYPGLVVAGFGEMREGTHADGLNRLILAHAPRHLGFERMILIHQPETGAPHEQLIAYASQNHGGPERLGDVVGNAFLEGALLILVGILGGEKDDRNIACRLVRA